MNEYGLSRNRRWTPRRDPISLGAALFEGATAIGGALFGGAEVAAPALLGASEVGGAAGAGLAGTEIGAGLAASTEVLPAVAGASGAGGAVAPTLGGLGELAAPIGESTLGLGGPSAGVAAPAAGGPEFAQFAGSTLSSGDVIGPAGEFSTGSNLGGLGESTSPIGATGDSLTSGETLGGRSNLGNPPEPSIGQGLADSTVTTSFETPTSGGGGLGDAASSAFGAGKDALGGLASAARSYAPLAGVGLLGYEALRGPPKIPGQSAAVSAANLPLVQENASFGTEALKLGEAGKITPAQQAQIQQYIQQQTNQLYQATVAAGQDPKTSTMYLQGVQQIQQQAVAMQQQFIDALIKEGLQAAGGASSSVLTTAQMQMQQDRDYQTALANATRAFGATLGGQPQTKNA